MRGSEHRAIKMIAILKSLGIKSAETMPIEEACKQYSRVQRGAHSRGRYMTAVQLDARGRQRRRSQQTHPGKR